MMAQMNGWMTGCSSSQAIIYTGQHNFRSSALQEGSQIEFPIDQFTRYTEKKEI